MEFALIANDGTDKDALARRLAVREAHMKLAQKMRDEGHFIHGGAMLDDNGQMIGSILVCDFPDRQALDAHLATDPYVTGDVWRNIQIIPFKTAPPFADNIRKPAGQTL